jgi:hypothetical protein
VDMCALGRWGITRAERARRLSHLLASPLRSKMDGAAPFFFCCAGEQSQHALVLHVLWSLWTSVSAQRLVRGRRVPLLFAGLVDRWRVGEIK